MRVLPHRLRLAALAVALAWLMPAGARAPASHVVRIDAMAFIPAVIEVNVGDSVTWQNSDPFPHTVSAPDKFTSPDIPGGAAWTLAAKQKGRFAYICTLHPTMKAVLVVK